MGEARHLSLIVARRVARQHEDAEDIAQEALLRAWRHRHRLRDQDAFRPWLAQIVHREAARRYASGRPAPTAELTEEVAVDSYDPEAVDVGIDVNRAIAALDERERLLIRLRYEEDWTQPAIAGHLGMPEGTVKVMLHRARNKLRMALGEP